MSRDEEDTRKATGRSSEPQRANKLDVAPEVPEGEDYDRAQHLGRMLLVQKFGDAARRAESTDVAAGRNMSGARARGFRALQQKREKMRRESGNTPREDTQDAATRGIASPATALPHAEKIQASFGSGHDVSQIKAHVGGDSASAMGAKAYATGDHVVFDQQPDLHTAAHEAAHVVQQSHGVQLYGGVGREGDSYERNADDVADRVVSGQSAADLLGGATSAVGASKARIQRKAHGATESAQSSSGHTGVPRDGEPKVKAQALITGLHAAQHALQKPDPDAGEVVAHLMHVLNVAMQSGPEAAGDRDVIVAADSFDHAVHYAQKKQGATFDRSVDLNAQIRSELGLSASGHGKLTTVPGSDAAVAKKAISPALDVLGIRTSGAVTALEETHAPENARQRFSIIEFLSGEIDFTSQYVHRLLGRVPEGERDAFQPAADRAAYQIGRVLRWVRTRANHKDLEARLLRGVHVFDGVLNEINSPTVEERDAAPLSERAQNDADEEQKELKLAQSDFIAALETVQTREYAAIENFFELAKLTDVESLDFKIELLKSLMQAAIGELLDSVARVAAASSAARESVFKVGLKSSHEALTKVAADVTVDPKQRALIFFRSGLRKAAQDRYIDQAQTVRDVVIQGEITAGLLHAMAHRLQAGKATIEDGYRQQIANAWAAYLAQSRLGTRGSGSNKTSKMDDYFGERRGAARLPSTSQAGQDGALSITMRIAEGSARPKVVDEATEIIGLNSQLKSDVLARAGYRFNEVRLPKEVHVEVGFARATIALDEKNRIRDVLNWHEVLRHVGGLSAYAFWQVWGKHLELR